MKRSTWKLVLLNGAGVLLYLLGMLVFAFTAINVYLEPPANSFENLSSGHMVLLAFGVGLLVAGRLVLWKFSDGREDLLQSAWSPLSRAPEQNALEQLGYRMPPEESNNKNSAFAYIDGELYLVCEECGSNNEPGFQYCSNCSEKLPESAE